MAKNYGIQSVGGEERRAAYMHPLPSVHFLFYACSRDIDGSR